MKALAYSTDMTKESAVVTKSFTVLQVDDITSESSEEEEEEVGM